MIAIAAVALVTPVLLGLVAVLGLNWGWISSNDLGAIVSVVALVATLYVAIFTGYLSWKALVFGAPPRIMIRLTRANGLRIGEKMELEFFLENVGWFFAKPAASNVKCFLNTDPEIQLLSAEYGSTLERKSTTVQIGKGGAKYLTLSEIWLYPREIGEKIRLHAVAPQRSGTRFVWISATCDQCDLGTFHFPIEIRLT